MEENKEQQPPTQPVQIPTDVHKPKNKFPIIIGGVLLLLLIGGGSYYLGANQSKKITVAPTQSPSPTLPQPTQNPTANWETYTNQQEHYAFQYPKDRYTTPSINDTSAEYTSVSIHYCPTQKLEDCAYPSNIFQVSVVPNTQNQSFESWLKTSVYAPDYLKDGKQYCFMDDSRTKKSNEEFHGQQAIIYKYYIDETSLATICKGKVMEGGGEYKDIVFQKGNKFYKISISLAQSNIYPELEQILSTFKFTN